MRLDRDDTRSKMKIDWTRSVAEEFQLRHGQVAVFVCQPNGAAANVLDVFRFSKPWVRLALDHFEPPD